ncbi:MAG: hypothetical protein K1060chlam2_00330 [Chlamydiae bacterium]|nr:hypothetical protein [Chlamydiota bacterium]
MGKNFPLDPKFSILDIEGMKLIFNKFFPAIAKPFKGYFNLLLVSLILLFVFRPHDRGQIFIVIWQIFLVIVFLSATYNCNHSKKVRISAACVGVPALILQWINLFYPDETLALLFIFLIIAFIFITTSSIIGHVVINARVRLETLKGVVCAYFMIAFGFSFLYFFISLLNPETFYFSNFEISPTTYSHYLSELMYYSFGTLLTLGYGDIIAVGDVAQTISILEGVIGQFYIAILVSRLVGVYSFYEHKLNLSSKQKKLTP